MKRLSLLFVIIPTVAFALGSESEGIRGSYGEFKNYVKVDHRAVEALNAGATIHANACGGLKSVSALVNVTTNTTNTFDAPSATNAGCVMFVCNASSATITLDANAKFATVSGNDVALSSDDCVSVGSDGSAWRQLSPVTTNLGVLPTPTATPTATATATPTSTPTATPTP